MPRLIAIDLDGTALDRNNELAPRAVGAIRAAVATGITVIVVTGRHHGATRAYHAQIGLETPAICCNGTYIYDFAENRVVDGVSIPHDAACETLGFCRERDLNVLIYGDDIMAAEEDTEHLRTMMAWGARQPDGLRPDIRLMPDLDALIDNSEQVWKFVISSADAPHLAACATEIRAQAIYQVDYSWTDRVDIVPQAASKGRRLMEWAARQGIAPADIMAIGDNGNDVSMIRMAGLGIAMENAVDELKAVADAVTSRNDAGGVADAIERYALDGARQPPIRTSP